MPAITIPARQRRQIASLAANVLIVAMEIAGLILSIRNHGIALFQFYTEDSNLLAMAACALCAGYTVRNLRHGAAALPRWVKILKFMAVCCLAVTFVVVLVILAPTAGRGGFRMMFLYSSMLYHHLLCPVLALVSFILWETDPPLTRRHIRYALIPTLLYAAAALTLNILRLMDGPYPFLHVYEQPVYMSVVWCLLILGGAYLLAWLIQLANTACFNRLQRKAA